MNLKIKANDTRRKAQWLHSHKYPNDSVEKIVKSLKTPKQIHNEVCPMCKGRIAVTDCEGLQLRVKKGITFTKKRIKFHCPYCLQEIFVKKA